MPARIKSAVLMLVPMVALCAVFTSRLQNNTIAVWNKYVDRAERNATALPLLDVSHEAPALVDLNPEGDNAGEDVPGGYIHHWIGAIRIPNATVTSVQAVLGDYQNYTRIYGSDLKSASAAEIAEDTYDVRLVSERVEGLGVRFAFDIRSRVEFRTVNGEARIDSRSYSIRESNSGKPPYQDLLPEGNDHGIVWRLNSYWRLRQTGTSVYAECQVISLSRKPLLGMHDLMKSRARDSLEATLQQTLARVPKAGK